MNKIGLFEVFMENRSKKNMLIAFILLAFANIFTDITVAQIPVTGDIINSVLDLIFEIIQLGILAKIARDGYYHK